MKLNEVTRGEFLDQLKHPSIEQKLMGILGSIQSELADKGFRVEKARIKKYASGDVDCLMFRVPLLDTDTKTIAQYDQMREDIKAVVRKVVPDDVYSIMSNWYTDRKEVESYMLFTVTSQEE